MSLNLLNQQLPEVSQSLRTLSSTSLRQTLSRRSPAYKPRKVSLLPNQCIRQKASLTGTVAHAPTSTQLPAHDAGAAVSSILYETSKLPSSPPKRHILHCLVQNEMGILSRITGLIAARGFNIDSLVVCNTEVEDLSRATIVLEGSGMVVEQVRRQIEDLVRVWAVLDLTNAELVQRELLLAKVSILGPEVHRESMEYHVGLAEELHGGSNVGVNDAQITSERQESAERNVDTTAPDCASTDLQPPQDQSINQPTRRDMAPSQALRNKYSFLKALTHLTREFGGKVLDISTNNCIIELCAKPSRINSFMKLIEPFGILESTRTGVMGLPRSPLDDSKVSVGDNAEDEVDPSTLPPG